MASDSIGRLFPAGGPVPRELIVGRSAVIAELQVRIEERIHTLLVGERRIGKTTVCNAVSEQLQEREVVVFSVEVPESPDGAALRYLLAARFRAASLAARGRRLLRVVQPLIEEILRDEGVPMDLSALARPGSPPSDRALLSLPLRLARESGRHVVLYMDELQRVVDYADGRHLLSELVDLYSGETAVTLLIDGSDERAFAGMMGPPIGFGKLVDSWPLDPRIEERDWRKSLPARFRAAGLEIGSEPLGKVIGFGGGNPYRTMTAARYAALNARKLNSRRVEGFEVTSGIEEARRHLEEDS